MNSRLKAWIEYEQWQNTYKVFMGMPNGDTDRIATGFSEAFETNRIDYESKDSNVQVAPFLRLTQSEYEALAKAFLEGGRPEDATVDALKDARSVRDRLLSMLEARGIR